MRAPDFWARPGPLGALLAPLGWAYGAAVAGRLKRRRPWRAPVPVLCIGNVVAGGAGKTPVALALAARLQARGKAVHFLSRGYGGRERGPLAVDPERHSAVEVGDEPLLLARQAPTWVAADRPAGARAAVAAGAGIVVMDDGYQNPALAKDLSLLVVDGGYGFGNGRVIPAGPLREPVAAALSRAQGVVLLGEDERGVAGEVDGRVPLLRARAVPGPEAEALRRRRVVAFAGIGRPEKLFASLRSMDCELLAGHAFADHHPYTGAEIDRLRQEARRGDAVLVTTAKDAVRLPPETGGGITVLTIGLEWDDEAALDTLLEPLYAHV